MQAMMSNLPSMMASMGSSSNGFLKPGSMEVALAFQSFDELKLFVNSTNVSDQVSSFSKIPISA